MYLFALLSVGSLNNGEFLLNLMLNNIYRNNNNAFREKNRLKYHLLNRT